MKQQIIFLSLSLIFACQLSAQPGWVLVNTNTEEVFLKTKFVTENTGYAISFNKVFKTTNSGLNWESKFIAPGDNILTSLFIIDENIIHICGGRYDVYDIGISFRSLDGGNSWSSNQFSGTFIQDIFFINSQTGYQVSGHTDFGVISSGHIFKTINGGHNWFTVNNDSTSTQNTFYSKVYFINEHTGWVGGVYTAIRCFK